MRRLCAFSLLVLLSCSRPEAPPSPAPASPESPAAAGDVVVRIGDGTLAVEVAATPSERARGLMHRTSLAPDAGMLFLFPGRQRGGFWMKNTLIPLSIAFVADAGDGTAEVVDVLEMEPCASDPCPTYDPRGPYDLAVEANAGWFEGHGVRRGRASFTIEGRLPQAS